MCGALDHDEGGVCATIRVEGTATSNELVIVQAVQVNAQASGR